MGQDHSLVLWQLHVYFHSFVHIHEYLQYTRMRVYILKGTYAAAHIYKHKDESHPFCFFFPEVDGNGPQRCAVHVPTDKCAPGVWMSIGVSQYSDCRSR
jgi:hypothetical protein